jgi:hypothetical protein
MGLSLEPERAFMFLFIVILAVGVFTFSGHMLATSLRDSQSAQGIGALILAWTSLFSGVFIRPDQIPSFWLFMYWILPGHYLMEALFMSQFSGDEKTIIEATPGSPFYVALGCTDPNNCFGSISDWVHSNFTNFSIDNIAGDIVYLICVSFLLRLIAYYALTNLNFRST